jgi:hypothetical protein
MKLFTSCVLFFVKYALKSSSNLELILGMASSFYTVYLMTWFDDMSLKTNGQRCSRSSKGNVQNWRYAHAVPAGEAPVQRAYFALQSIVATRVQASAQ